MGQRCCKPCPLSKEELDDYALLTFLSRTEIISVFSKFQKLDPISVEENRNVRLTIEQVLSGVEELRLNPFGDRICQSFAAENDGKMGFEDFLDMYSVLSDAATPEIKMHFAFNTYDFDKDGVLCKPEFKFAICRSPDFFEHFQLRI